jgi:hypothetical protein
MMDINVYGDTVVWSTCKMVSRKMTNSNKVL